MGAWVRLVAVMSFALPVHVGLAAAKPSVTIVDLESLMAGRTQNGADQNKATVTAKPAAKGPPPLFSAEWEKVYSSGRIGCHLGRKRYVWRPCGFGSNIVRKSGPMVRVPRFRQ